MIRFYAPQLRDTCCLPEDESGHCVRVLRLREGDEVNVVDGTGHAYVCRIADADPRRVGVEILGSADEPSPWRGRLTLAVAPTKNADRMEWLVEKAVETGVDEVVLLRCDRSERRKMRTDRLERIMVSAMKQSLKAVMPGLRGPLDFDEFMAETASACACKVMGYCSPLVDRRDFGSVFRGTGDLVALIGPEGDFSPGEVEMAMKTGYVPVTFGRSRLRTETAAMYAVTAFHVLGNLRQSCETNQDD